MEIYYFTAPWCVPCKAFGPVMEKLSEDYQVNKINIDEDIDSAVAHGVLSVPTVVVVTEGEQTEVARFVGARPYDWVVDFLEEMEY